MKIDLRNKHMWLQATLNPTCMRPLAAAAVMPQSSVHSLLSLALAPTWRQRRQQQQGRSVHHQHLRSLQLLQLPCS